MLFRSGIQFGKVKIASDIKPESLPSYIEHEYTPKSSNIDEWNYNIIYNLPKHVDTEYCILIHDNGFIVNPESWRSEFLNYDYIGAPWMIAPDAYLDPWGKGHRVGNGGFSFRSKKLLDVPKRAYVHFDVNWGDFYKHMGVGFTSEDGIICVHNRHIYEAVGCKIAPIEVAARFSHEKPLPETQGIIPFGFHYHLPAGTVL